ncbi:hypothetical protein [Variovorax sp. DAIF25]|uniref:hypothetical protein n=1 Tax=Variovorax sp. DAIF25 TaxID=3080983 RepID=UPI003D6B46D0
MRSDTSSTPPATTAADGYLQPVLDWQTAICKNLWLAQRQQWEAMAAWQRAIGAVQHELMDEWICRFGGGVPLDG